MGGPDKSGLSFGTTYTLSAISACIAETSTFPFDMVKTRLMIQGETLAKDAATSATANQQRGLVDMARGISRDEVRRLSAPGSVPDSCWSVANASCAGRCAGNPRFLPRPRTSLPTPRHLQWHTGDGVRAVCNIYCVIYSTLHRKLLVRTADMRCCVSVC